MPRQIKPRTAGESPSSSSTTVVKLRRSSSKTDLVTVSRGGGVSQDQQQQQQQRRDSLTASPPASGFLAKVTCWQQRIDPEAEVNLNRKKKQQRPASIAVSEGVSLKAVAGGSQLKRVPSLGSLPVMQVEIHLPPTPYPAILLNPHPTPIFNLTPPTQPRSST